MLYAYVDESGQRGHSDDASEHFVMSAVMFRSRSMLLAPRALLELRAITGRQPTHELSFKRLSDGHRATVANYIGGLTWMRLATVVVCKKHLPDSLADDSLRYLYAFRLLLERISWLAHSYGEVAEYTLSHIQRFKLESLREYESRLRKADTQIRWSNLDPSGGAIDQPKRLEQLQFADLVASSCGIAFNPSPKTGVTDQSYMQALRPAMYVRNGKLHSYGVKMHPWNDSTKAAYPWVAAL